MIKTAFPPISNPGSKILLLGTIPGEQSLKLQQYYGNKANHFWKIIFSLFNQPFSDDYEVKKQLLLTHGIALWDVLQYCEREGSSDNKIKNEVPNDFEKFYVEHPLINHVFLQAPKRRLITTFMSKENQLSIIMSCLLPAGQTPGKLLTKS